MADAVDRFMSRVNLTLTCWEWTGDKNWAGYGRFHAGGRPQMAHRWAYEHLVGPIPKGLQLDHLCRVRHCVNPAHLEPVTLQENLRRGEGQFKWKREATECLRGHPFDGANTYIRANGTRHCRACAAEHSRKYRRAS